MKRKLTLALLLMLLLASFAIAENAKAEFFLNYVSEGIEYTYNYNEQAGIVTFEIDTEASDFEQALLFDGEGYIPVRYGFYAPGNARYFIDFNGNGCSTDEEFERFFAGMEEEGMYGELDPEYSPASYVFGNSLGEYLSERNMVILTPWDDTYSLVRWYDQDFNEIRTDKVLSKLSFTGDQDAIQLEHDIMTDPSTLYPNANGVPGLTGAASRGVVDYAVDTAELPKEGKDFVRTEVAAPENAASCILRTVMGEDLNPYDPEIENGRVSIRTRFADSGYEDGRAILIPFEYQYYEIYDIAWYDGEGEKLSETLLRVNITPPADPWSCYIEDWTPVPADRLQLDAAALGSACSYDYDENKGILHFSFDAEAVTAEELTGAKERLYVKPPKGAKSYRVNRSGGSDFFGRDDFLQSEQNAVVKQKTAQAITAKKPTAEARNGALYRVIHQTDIMKLYQPFCETQPGYGSTYLIYWYSNEKGTGNPICMEYINEFGDPMLQTTEIAPARSEAELDIGDGIGFVFGGDGNLQVVEYPQITEGCYCYELQLVTPSGKPVRPNQDLYIYLPYPADGGYYDDYSYFVRHYNEDYTSFTLEVVVKTMKGLRFKAESFSPFVCGQGDLLPIPEKHVLLPTDLTEIEAEAFMGLSEIEYAVVPEGCTAIGARAFKDCVNLTYIKVPEGITIAEDAFEGCPDTLRIVAVPAQ